MTKRIDTKKIIASAIKKSDKTYFFENYIKQADSVIKALEYNGFKIVPKEPTDNMISSGVWSINLGLIDAKKLAKKVYQEMINIDN